MTTQIVQFIIKHWLLCAAFVVVLGLIIFEELRAKGGLGRGGQLSTQMVTHYINKESAAVIDIRDPAAYRSGHITGSINMVEADVDLKLSKLKKYQKRQVIIVDAMGTKAAKTVSLLQKQGFANVTMLKGGIDAWRGDNLPLIKAKKGKNDKN